MCLLLGLGISNAEERVEKRADERIAGRLNKNPLENNPIDWLRPVHRVLAGLAVVLALVAGYFLWGTMHISAANDISSHLEMRSPENYLTGMVHLLDLTPESVADLRLPIILSALSVLLAFVAAWALRERGIRLLPNIALALGMVGFIVAAHIAHDALNPTLSSRTLAMDITQDLKPDDQIALYGDIRVAPGIAFYSHRNVLLYDATGSNLEFGSHYPDAPKRFFGDADFSALWRGTRRVFLVVPSEHKEEVRERLQGNSMWVFAETGGKTVYVNRQPETGQLPVGSLVGKLKLEPAPSRDLPVSLSNSATLKSVYPK
jgi:hypothetical protein